MAAFHAGTEPMILNFANCDMVDYAGNIAALIKSVEMADTWVGAVVKRVLSLETPRELSRAAEMLNP